jgi:glycosyltransferase involved in cell wall biosynthesis
VKLSIIIPARQELYLQNTISDVLTKATGDIEVIAILDGYWPDPPLKDDKRLIVIHRERKGMRAAINAGIAVSRGEYIMKTDAHCMFAPGFDETLKADCDGDWIVVPRRYSLDIDTWNVRLEKMPVDYEYLGWPYHKRMSLGTKAGFHAWTWDARIEERADRLIDENMIFQGSCWCTTRTHFDRQIGRMNEEGYGTFIGEALELGLKTWLGGGKVMVNKKTWYAHLYKGKGYREKYQALFNTPYSRVGFAERKVGNAFTVKHWMNESLSWLIERFWPIPSWPEDRSEWYRVPEWHT